MSDRSLLSLESWSLQTPQNAEFGIKSTFPTCKTYLVSAFREEQQTGETSSMSSVLLQLGESKSVYSCCLFGCPHK